MRLNENIYIEKYIKPINRIARGLWLTNT